MGTKKDYRTEPMLPQRNMSWSQAIVFMLQSEDNIVFNTHPNPYAGTYYLKIADGTLWYRCDSWEPEHWAQVGNRDFNDRKRWSALTCEETVCCAPSMPNPIMSKLEEISDRIGVVERKLAGKERNRERGGK